MNGRSSIRSNSGNAKQFDSDLDSDAVESKGAGLNGTVVIKSARRLIFSGSTGGREVVMPREVCDVRAWQLPLHDLFSLKPVGLEPLHPTLILSYHTALA